MISSEEPEPPGLERSGHVDRFDGGLGRSISSHSAIISVAIGASVVVRLVLFSFESGDYRLYLSKWYDYLVEHGRWNALRDNFSNYPPLYLYLLIGATWLPLPKLYAIKVTSILFDYLAAYLLFRIVRIEYPKCALPAVALVVALFLPTTVLNSAMWGQCDAIYTSALLGALYFLLKASPLLAFIAYGLACSLKPQAIFLLPFLIGLHVKGTVPRWSLLISAGVYVLCGVPVAVAGRPLFEVVFHWLLQRNAAGLKLGAPNWYLWLPENHEVPEVLLRSSGYATACLAALIIVASMLKMPQERRLGVRFALLSVMLMPYLLPGMHERYFYAADLFSLAYAFYVPGGWIVAILVQVASFFTYLPYLLNIEPVPRPWLALGMTAALAIVITDLRRRLRGES